MTADDRSAYGVPLGVLGEHRPCAGVHCRHPSHAVDGETPRDARTDELTGRSRHVSVTEALCRSLRAQNVELQARLEAIAKGREEAAEERDEAVSLLAEAVRERDAAREALGVLGGAAIRHCAAMVRLTLPGRWEGCLKKNLPDDFEVVARDDVARIAMALRSDADVARAALLDTEAKNG